MSQARKTHAMGGSPTLYVLGLDLSLRGAAAVLVPAPWDLDFSRVLSMRVGASLTRGASEIDRDARCKMIASEIATFCIGREVGAAFVEGYSFGSPMNAHQLGELRGVVRRMLVDRFGFAAMPVPPHSARKFFFGSKPSMRSDMLKDFILESVNATGAKFATHDEADAFLVANFGLTEIGHPAISNA